VAGGRRFGIGIGVGDWDWGRRLGIGVGDWGLGSEFGDWGRRLGSHATQSTEPRIDGTFGTNDSLGLQRRSLSLALGRRPGAVREVAIALGTLGQALAGLRQHGEAAAVHREELGLKRALAGLATARAATGEEVRAALGRRPGAVREVAIALGRLGQALAGLRENGGPLETSASGLRPRRRLCGRVCAALSGLRIPTQPHPGLRPGLLVPPLRGFDPTSAVRARMCRPFRAPDPTQPNPGLRPGLICIAPSGLRPDVGRAGAHVPPLQGSESHTNEPRAWPRAVMCRPFGASSRRSPRGGLRPLPHPPTPRSRPAAGARGTCRTAPSPTGAPRGAPTP
jgi:hypothetical protein